jgi:Icc-related predicted phosphoesterase
MNKIVCISDMHSMYRQIDMPDGDILVVAGDMTNVGSSDEIMDFSRWLEDQPHKYKLVVAGNHDWGFYRRDFPGLCLENIPNTFYLEDSGVNIEGINFYGSPWQPEFCNWAFNLPRGDKLAEVWAKIPLNTDVLVTHSPPWGILDTVRDSLPLGCQDLLDRVNMVKPKLHVFGHIHYSYGYRKFLDTMYVNAAICTERYKPTNQPIVVDYTDEGVDISE